MESSPRVTKCFAIITSAHTHPHVTGREAEGQGSSQTTWLVRVRMAEVGSGLSKAVLQDFSAGPVA